MKCPSCRTENLAKADYKDIQLDYCPTCYGVWFDRDELRRVKDKEDEFLRWIDFDPWEDEAKFGIDKSPRICPKCGVPFYTVNYAGLPIKIDLCNVCQGIWLDKGEFDKIIKYLEDKVSHETLAEYFEDIGEEFVEVFTGPEKISSEIADLVMVMKLLEYRLLAKIPAISHIIAHLPG